MLQTFLVQHNALLIVSCLKTQVAQSSRSKQFLSQMPNILRTRTFIIVFKSLPLISILGQINHHCPLKYRFFKIRSNILPSTPRSCKWSLSFRFPHHNFMRVSIRRMRKARLVHLILTDLTIAVFGEAQYCSGDKIEKNEMGWACGAYG